MNNKIKILLDAGHYGKQNKYHVLSPIEYYESQMAWKLHLYLKEELEEYGFIVATTRDKQEIDLPVAERGKLAKGYDLLLSLHSNTAEKESVDRAVIIPLQELDWTDIDDTSAEIATVLGDCIQDTMGLSSCQIYRRKASWDRDGNGKVDDEYYGIAYGARLVGTPVVILEHGFHTNKKTAQWLYDENNLKKLARAEAATLAEYYGKERITEAESIAVRDAVTIASGAYYKGNVKKVPEEYTSGRVFTVSHLLESKGQVYALIDEITSWISVEYLEKIVLAENKDILFADVDNTSPYYETVKWACENGLIEADSALNFAPESPIAKHELYKALKIVHETFYKKEDKI